MTSKPDLDQRLVDAHDLALAALREITPASTIGPAAGYLPEEDGSVSLRFENRLSGYPGWYWTVTVARVDDEEPTVLEVELLPGEGALLAPEWVPWAERLAEYRAHQAELAEQAAAAADGEASDSDALEVADEDDDLDDDDLEDDEEIDDEDDDLEDDDLEDDDDDDEDDDEDDLAAEPRVLHAGDLDGVDIDELDDSGDDIDDSADEDDDDSAGEDDEDDDEEE